MFALLDKLNLDKEKVIAIVAAAAVIAVLDIMFVIGPQFQKSAKMGKEIKKSRTEITALRKELGSAKQQQEKMQREKGVQTSQHKIYTLSEMPQLLQDISSMATQKNVSIRQMTPLKEQAGKGKKGGSISGDFVQLKIQLNMECGYHGLGAFLSEMENSRQPLFAEEIHIIGNDLDNLKSTVNMVVKTYVKQ